MTTLENRGVAYLRRFGLRLTALTAKQQGLGSSFRKEKFIQRKGERERRNERGRVSIVVAL